MAKKKQPTLFEEEEQPVDNLKVKYAGIIKEEEILTLDIATVTGFACKFGSGTWNLTPKKDESKGMRLVNFGSKLIDIHTKCHLKLIVYEAPAIRGKFPNFVAMEMIGVLKKFCEENKIDYSTRVVQSIKKFATGKGSAPKEEMILAAKRKFGIEIKDDNHADALHLFDMVLHEYGIRTHPDPF